MNLISLAPVSAMLIAWAWGGWFAQLPPGAQWMIALWIFALGACFGSFMNVVIYRTPAGLSVVAPGSRCGACLHPVRGFDNVPIFSWFLLRGRCRDCGAAFSIRYPLVEAAVATILLGLAAVDVFSGGATLPARPLRDAVTHYSPSELWGVFGCHVMLLCTLICAAMIERDGQSAPPKLFAPALACGVGAMVVWPAMAAMRVSAQLHEPSLLLLEAFFSTMIGAGFGLLVAPIARRCRAVHRDARLLAFSLGLCGWHLGTLGVIVVACLTTLAALAARTFERGRPEERRLPVVGWVAAAALLVIALWQPIVQANSGPAPRWPLVRVWLEAPEWQVGGGAAALIALSAMATGAWTSLQARAANSLASTATLDATDSRPKNSPSPHFVPSSSKDTQS